MTDAAQSRATRNYRARFARRGFTRFEVMAREADRDLIRTLARRLSEEGPEAERARSTVRTVVVGALPKPGNILAALRRSPMVGADLEISRPREKGRRVDL